MSEVKKHNCPWRAQPLLLFFLLYILQVSCSPGFDYRPLEWPQEKDSLKWKKTYSTFVLEVPRLAEGLYSNYLGLGVTITNCGEAPLTLESAELIWPSGVQQGNLPGSGRLDWRTIPPSASDRLMVDWTFDEMVTRRVGKRVTVVLLIRQGPELTRVEIPYEVYRAGSFWHRAYWPDNS